MAYQKITAKFADDLQAQQSQQTDSKRKELDEAVRQTSRRYCQLDSELLAATPKHHGLLLQKLPGLSNFKTLQKQAAEALLARDKAKAALDAFITAQAALAQEALLQLACVGMEDGAILQVLKKETSKPLDPAAYVDKPLIYENRKNAYKTIPSFPEEWKQVVWGSEKENICNHPQYYSLSLVLGKNSFLGLTAITGIHERNFIYFPKTKFPGGGLLIAAGNGLPVYRLQNVQSVRLCLEDDDRQQIGHLLEPITRQMAKAKLERRWVVVHCQDGVSRSASIVLAYMIRFCGMSLEKAFWSLRDCRCMVRPNLYFLHQLLLFEDKYYYGPKRTPTRKIQLNGVYVAVPQFIQRLGSFFSKYLFT